MAKGLILALGGNALIREGEEGDIAQQYKHTCETFAPIIPLVRKFDRVLVVHGNGPQVGNELLRNEVASYSVSPFPLDVLVANSQGGMGYMIQQVLRNELRRHKIQKAVVTVVTQSLVQPDDPAFDNPTKPIGVFFKEKDAERYKKLHGWQMVEDAGRGYRRVVASPKPEDIIEMRSIRALFNAGSIVIAGGGGGIPVFRDDDGILKGVEAVVDKDYVTSFFALDLMPELLVMLTAVKQVSINHNKPNEKPIAQMGLDEVKKHLAGGEFGVGSMEPKITCAVDYLEAGGKEVLITAPECLADALEKKTGTWLTRGA